MSIPSSSALSQYRFRTPFWESQAYPQNVVDVGGVRPVAVLEGGVLSGNFLPFRQSMLNSHPVLRQVTSGISLNASVALAQWRERGVSEEVVTALLPAIDIDTSGKHLAASPGTSLSFDELMDFLVWFGEAAMRDSVYAVFESDKGTLISFRELGGVELSRAVTARHGSQHPVTEAEIALIPVVQSWTLDAYTFTVEQVQNALAYDMSNYFDFHIYKVESRRIESVMSILGDNPLLLCWLWVSAECSRTRGGEWQSKKALKAVTHDFIEPLMHLNPRTVMDYLSNGVTDANTVLAYVDDQVDPDLVGSINTAARL